MKTSIDGFADIIMEELEKFKDLEIDTVREVTSKVARKTAKKLRERSPKRTGEYAEGWRATETAKTANRVRYDVHNTKKHQITHLLENGHAKRGGGRVAGKPHIAPTEEEAVREYEEELLKKL